MDDSEQYKSGLEEQVKAYKKLSKIKDSKEFQDFFEHQLEILSQKVLWTFTTGKDGDNIKNWDDFCKVRGEIVARLQPLQDVYAAEGIIAHLQEQLKRYYTPID